MKQIQVIHQTDIFVPPADPDDHFDLATQFGLARMGKTWLGDVLIDWPPDWHSGAPAIDSVAQLSLLTGIWPRVAIGAPRSVEEGHDTDAAAAEMLLSALDHAADPVDIHIVGSCSDVAMAAQIDPGLIERKCRRIYVNAGSSRPFADAPAEYNTALDPSAYRAMFSLPCPTYWLPCFEVVGERIVSEFSSHWSFEQGPLVEKLPARVRQYFVWAFDDCAHRNWLDALNADIALSAERCGERRSMWSTAGFFHGANLRVLTDGGLSDESSDPGVFDFITVDWSCDDQGRTTWSPSAEDNGRYLFKVTDQVAYESAMTTALLEVLQQIDPQR